MGVSYLCSATSFARTWVGYHQTLVFGPFRAVSGGSAGPVFTVLSDWDRSRPHTWHYILCGGGGCCQRRQLYTVSLGGAKGTITLGSGQSHNMSTPARDLQANAGRLIFIYISNTIVNMNWICYILTWNFTWKYTIIPIAKYMFLHLPSANKITWYDQAGEICMLYLLYSKNMWWYFALQFFNYMWLYLKIYNLV